MSGRAPLVPCCQMNDPISLDTGALSYPAFNGGMARH